MFSRRSGKRFNRGRIQAEPPDVKAWQIVQGATVLAAWRADIGVTKDGSRLVSLWKDQVGSSDFSQSGAARPLWANNVINGHPVIRGDGVAQYIDCTLARAVPFFIWAVAVQRSWGSNERLWDDTVSGGSVSCRGSASGAGTPNLRLANPTVGPDNANATIGTPRRYEALYGNAASDYLKIGNTSASGNALGGATMAGIRLFAGGGVASFFGQFDVAELMVMDGVPSNLAALDSYAAARYGSGVIA